MHRYPGEPENWQALNPLATDEISPTSANGIRTEEQHIDPELIAKEARRFRRVTGSFEGGDRDKKRALYKVSKRISGSLRAGNRNGVLDSLQIVRRALTRRNGTA